VQVQRQRLPDRRLLPYQSRQACRRHVRDPDRREDLRKPRRRLCQGLQSPVRRSYCAAFCLVGGLRESCVSDQVKFVLDEKDIPKTCSNWTADLPKPLPPVLHPGTKKPIGPADLEPLFPMELIMQEVTGERYLDIPQPIVDVYRMWRPSPLMRALRLEQKLGTPAKIYFKYEGVSPAGSHKPNTAVTEGSYQKPGRGKRLSTETGAGQWGSSLAFAGALFGIDVTVFQVRVSYDQKPYRRALMETYGARCVASPSNETDSGRAVLKQHPDSPGSLGIAIS